MVAAVVAAAAVALVVALFAPGVKPAFADTTYHVTTADELTQAVAEINGADSGRFVISIEDDIQVRQLSFKANETTILGNGHTLDFSNATGDHGIVVFKYDDNSPTLHLGDSAASAQENALVIQGGNRYSCPFIMIGGSNFDMTATMTMTDGVVIRGAVVDNYLGGGVYVGCGGTFIMDGGTITECGVSGGSVCFGGGVAVVGGGTFVMNDGVISKCFLTQSYGESTDSYNLFYNYAAGAGVFVSNNSYFEMNGGSICDNRIVKKSEDIPGYGMGAGVAVMPSRYNEGFVVSSRFEMNGGEICRNSSNGAGGGVAVVGTQAVYGAIASPVAAQVGAVKGAPGVEINGGFIYDNTAAGVSSFGLGGGGLFAFMLSNNNVVKMENTQIFGNDAGLGFGGGVEALAVSKGYVENVTISGSYIVNNKAAYGGGIACFNSGSTAVQTLTFDEANPTTIVGNTASVGADDLFSYRTTITNLTKVEDMQPLVSNQTLVGWKWDAEVGAEGETLNYEGREIPMLRYDAETNNYDYEPLAVENTTTILYLKVPVVEQEAPGGDDNPGGGDSSGGADNPGGNGNPGSGDNSGNGNPGGSDDPGVSDNLGISGKPGSEAGSLAATGDVTPVAPLVVVCVCAAACVVIACVRKTASACR